MKVLLVGGELKSSTEAIVGGQATEMIRRYHFTKGFFGTNGVTKKTGFTTPEASEAVVKEIAMAHCRDRYVLADHDKFGQSQFRNLWSFSIGNYPDGSQSSGN